VRQVMRSAQQEVRQILSAIRRAAPPVLRHTRSARRLMKGFVLGVAVTLLAIAGGVYLVAQNGLYPIGADNPPGALERRLAMRAMDVYGDKPKPEWEHPVAATP